MKHTRLIGVVMAFCACGGQHGPSDARVVASSKTVTVCQLFANISSYQDRIVSVRGIFYFGLRQNNCPREFVAGNHKWPTALNLVDSRFPRDKYEQPVSFSTDEESWTKLQLLARSEGEKGQREEIWATVEGQLRGPRRKMPPGLAGGIGGYGHLGAFAAELVVRRIDNIEIRQTPTFDYSELLRPSL